MLRKGLAAGMLVLLLLTACAAPMLQENSRVVLLWYDVHGPREAALLRLVEAFNAAHDGVQVIAEYQDDLFRRTTMAPEGHRPDLVLVGTGGSLPYVEAGVDRAPERVSGAGFDADAFTPMAAAVFRGDEGWTAIPLGLRTYAFYYNADRLREAGLEAGQIADRASMQETLCSLSDAEKGSVGLALPAQAGLCLAWWRAGVDGESLAQLSALFTQGCARLYPHPAEAIAALVQGEAAALYASNSALPTIEAAMDAEEPFELGVVPLGGVEALSPTVWEGSGLVVVEGGAASEPSLASAVGWFAAAEAENLWQEATGELPPRFDLLKAGPPQATPARQLFYAIALEAAASDTIIPAVMLRSTEEQIALVAALRALADGQPVEQVLADLQAATSP